MEEIQASECLAQYTEMSRQVLPDGNQQVARTGGINGHGLNGIPRLEENQFVKPAGGGSEADAMNVSVVDQ